MSEQDQQHRVGEIRPSQLLYTYGVGAVVDLPRISVVVTGLEDWNVSPEYSRVIVEDRLLQAVRYELPAVKELRAPPVVADSGGPINPFDSLARVGVQVATFPRWMFCPTCGLLAPLKSGLFSLKANPFYPERTAYLHHNCTAKKPPEVVPARFLVACERGHLDDFPWVEYVHQGAVCSSPRLRLMEVGPSGEARDLYVRCDNCDTNRVLSDAFDTNQREKLPFCSGRRPHLRDYDETPCDLRIRPIILGASNTWFGKTLRTLAIPVASNRLDQLVEENWANLKEVTDAVILGFMRKTGQLGELAEYEDDDIWAAIQRARAAAAAGAEPEEEAPDLKGPEWAVFAQVDPARNASDFRLRAVRPPGGFEALIDEVVLAERLRAVNALVGFTRVDAPGELTAGEFAGDIAVAPLSRQPSSWVPASEVRGEGIFLRLNEAAVADWENRPAVQRRRSPFFAAHRKWRAARHIEPPEGGFPGMRYVLIHTLAHALMRQLALECGYAAASLQERIYAQPAGAPGGPMAGLLIYTAAPDSEGTLGGLVSLGEPQTLGRHLAQALEAAQLCASDPLCAEHPPSQRGRTLHAAACHACSFAPETACERGNKYLDRALLVPTVEHEDLAFFARR